MNVIEAINNRKSIRAYKPDPVPQEILLKVMEAATRAPSWSGQQPWDFYITGGKVMEEIKEALHKCAVTGAAEVSDVPRPTFPEIYQARGRENAALRFQAQGVARDDQEARAEGRLKGRRFFDAPNGIIICTEKGIGPYSLFDAGLAAKGIALAAVEYGLGTCIAYATVLQPEVLRRILGIPESKLIVIGMPIGYPDWEDKGNNFRSLREPLEKVTTWCGF